MSLSLSAPRRSGRIAAGLATLLALSAIAVAGPSQATAPAGSLVELFTESPTFTAKPANAISEGWWGHEGGTGPSGLGPTYLSLDGTDSNGEVTDASQAALLAALGTDNFEDIGYAVVPYTANGTNERPAISAGENAAEAFGWVINGAGGWGAGLTGGSASNDSVATVSTLAQLTAWVEAVRPLQGFDDNLVLHDLSDPSNPVSAKPKGKSILNAWPAGTQLSLVAYVTTGAGDPDLQNEVPLVEADGTGHAKTAWMPFTTVASPTSAVRTSAGYQVIGAYAPSITRTSTFSSTGATLKGTVKNNANGTATNATGNLEFAQVVGGVRSATTTLKPTSAGVASLSIPGFTSGTRVYDVRYVPDAAAQGTYQTTDWFRTTMTAPAATTTSLSVVGGSTYDTMTATVSPKTAGTVKFYDSTTLLKTMSVSSSNSYKAIYKKLLSARKHTLKATFTPTSASYKASTSATKTVYKPTISITKSPTTVHHGTYPKLTVKVVATGASVSGTITITYDPASGSTRTISGTLSHGVKTVTLPKSVAGTTKITVKYNGHSPVLAASKSYSYRVY